MDIIDARGIWFKLAFRSQLLSLLLSGEDFFPSRAAFSRVNWLGNSWEVKPSLPKILPHQLIWYTTVKLWHCLSKVGPYHTLDKGIRNWLIRWATSIPWQCHWILWGVADVWRSHCEHLGFGNPYNPTEIFKRRAMQMADLLIKSLRSYPFAGITPCLPSNPFLTKRILVNLFSSAGMQLLMAFLEQIPSQIPSISIRFCFQAGQRVFRSPKNHSKAKMICKWLSCTT